ncbi:MAG: insulinase family protein, partial [bacterium]
FEADVAFRAESAGGRANVLAHSELVTGDPRFSEAFLQKVIRLRPADVARAAARYLRPAGLTGGVFLPANGGGKRGGGGKGGGSGGGRALRQAVRRGFLPLKAAAGGGAGAPAAGVSGETGAVSGAGAVSKTGAGSGAVFSGKAEMKPARARIRGKGDRPYTAALPGGARLVVLPGGAAPVFALRAVFLGGQRLEGGERAGLHALMSNAAVQATRGIPSRELALRVDGLAASLTGFAGRNSFGVSASALSRVFPEVLEIFAEVLCAPAFDPEDVALARREAEADRKSDSDDLGHLSRLRTMALLYGTHPFARHPLGSRRTLAGVDGRCLRRAWRRWAAPGNLVIGAAGDVDPPELARRLRRLMRGWAERAPRWRSPRPPAAPRPSGRPRARRHAVADAAQCHIQLAYLGATFYDPRRIALSVAAAALGSQGGGLFMELRERRGLAYAVSASAEEALDPGPVTFYAATAPEREEEAVALMRAEIARAREEGLGREEVERAKTFLIGELVRGRQRAGGRASDLAFCARYGLRRETPEEVKARIRAVDREAVREAARAFLDPRRECLVRVGPKI